MAATELDITHSDELLYVLHHRNRLIAKATSDHELEDFRRKARMAYEGANSTRLAAEKAKVLLPQVKGESARAGWVRAQLEEIVQVSKELEVAYDRGRKRGWVEGLGVRVMEVGESVERRCSVM